MTMSPYKGKTGVRRLINAFGYSLSGLRSAFRHEDAFRQEVLLAAVLIPTALVLPVAATARAVLLGSVFLVLIVELLNTAVEAVVDRVSLEDHELAKRAKDIGSAAVMLSLACMAVIWAAILIGRPAEHLSWKVQPDVIETSPGCPILVSRAAYRAPAPPADDAAHRGRNGNLPP